MFEHKTVLLEEAIEYLSIKEDGIYVDATLGGGGHSAAILSRLTTGKLIAFDQDEYAISKAEERLRAIASNYQIIKANFVDMQKELLKIGIEHVDGVIYDLGVSSFQFDIPERGFSYKNDAPLDMRMDLNNPVTAQAIVNDYAYEDLVRIFYRYADCQYAKQIARRIENERQKQPILTTFQLVEIIKQALPQKVLNQKGHPAKKIFQALRIAVNDELRVFEESLHQAIELLNEKGRIVVITFHSLEDRICKSIFREESVVYIPKGVPIINSIEPRLNLITKHAIVPSDVEMENNNRAHSAHMRVVERNEKYVKNN